MRVMKQKEFIRTLEELAPPELAEDWDNTGLLIEPLTSREIKKVLLTIDLTETVAHEAIQKKADWIITYHPLFFGGFQRLEKSNPQARTAMRLIQKGIGVYSPHTALDAAPGGVNDWLADAVGDGDLYCAPESSARMIELFKPVKLSTLGKRIKESLHLRTIRLTEACNRPIKTVALCAGAGIETLRAVKADCYLTGEMKHHDILDAKETGTSVILCGHTETERGYLRVLRRRLQVETKEQLNVFISKGDTAPLKMV
jgi:dinuclear metal center YbgI/SA1388 family protein